MRHFVLALVLFWSTESNAVPIGRLQLWSEPGDPIGLGGTYDVTYEIELGDIAYATMDASGPGLVFDFARNTSAGLLDAFSLWLLAPRFMPDLQLGHYDEASNTAVPDKPAMFLQFQGRSASYSPRSAGSFTIISLDAFPYPSWPVDSSVVEFVQFADGSSAALRGRLEYNVAGLTNIPEPSSALLVGLGLGLLAFKLPPGKRRTPSRT